MRCAAGKSFLNSMKKQKEHIWGQSAQSLQMTDFRHSNGWRLRIHLAGPFKKINK